MEEIKAYRIKDILPILQKMSEDAEVCISFDLDFVEQYPVDSIQVEENRVTFTSGADPTEYKSEDDDDEC